MVSASLRGTKRRFFHFELSPIWTRITFYSCRNGTDCISVPHVPCSLSRPCFPPLHFFFFLPQEPLPPPIPCFLSAVSVRFRFFLLGFFRFPYFCSWPAPLTVTPFPASFHPFPPQFKDRLHSPTPPVNFPPSPVNSSVLHFNWPWTPSHPCSPLFFPLSSCIAPPWIV